jgi:hypothetical protein
VIRIIKVVVVGSFNKSTYSNFFMRMDESSHQTMHAKTKKAGIWKGVKE